MIAAYLSVAAIISALLVACIATGLVLGLYGPYYSSPDYCRYNRYYRRNYW